jgi:cell division protein FtsW
MSGKLTSRSFMFDPMMVAAVIALGALGTVMVCSASISLADQQSGQPLYYLVRHLGALGIGCLGGLVMIVVPSELWYRLDWALLIVALALLAAVLVPGFGHAVNGSARWITMGPLRLQASEPARLLLQLYLASYVVRHHRELASSLAGFVKPLLVVGAAAALLLMEPDFGAAVVLTATSFGILFVGGARLRDFLLSALVAGAGLGVLAFSSPYRLARLTTFLDPWADPYASGFQLTQSLIAIGRGDWFGVGLGGSVQKLFYLPEAHTDFVFAVLTEELGFVGASAVIVLFAILVYRALALGRKALLAGRPFQGLVSTGIGLALGLEAFINIGVNTGLLPTKGLTLPLLSYGRSSTVVTLMSLGLLIRIHHEVQLADERRRARQRSAS